MTAQYPDIPLSGYRMSGHGRYIILGSHVLGRSLLGVVESDIDLGQ
jgi:hypothetical protein